MSLAARLAIQPIEPSEEEPQTDGVEDIEIQNDEQSQKNLKDRLGTKVYLYSDVAHVSKKVSIYVHSTIPPAHAT